MLLAQKAEWPIYTCQASVAWPGQSDICSYRQSKWVKMSKSPSGHVTPRVLPTHAEGRWGWRILKLKGTGYQQGLHLPPTPPSILAHACHPPCTNFSVPVTPQISPHPFFPLSVWIWPPNRLRKSKGCPHVPLSPKLYGFCPLICLHNKPCQPAH